jgi:hypothetical protein
MGHVRRYPPVRFAVRVELDQKEGRIREVRYSPKESHRNLEKTTAFTDLLPLCPNVQPRTVRAVTTPERRAVEMALPSATL